MWKSWLLALSLVALALVPIGGSSASCAGPSLELGSGPHPVISPGQPVTVRGRAFVDGCDDTGGGDTLGCRHEQPEAVQAQQDVVLRLRQDGRSWNLGTSDAGAAAHDHLGQVSWQARVPSTVHEGNATLEAGDATLQVLVGPGPSAVPKGMS
jgi:hypothetical protein